MDLKEFVKDKRILGILVGEVILFFAVIFCLFFIFKDRDKNIAFVDMERVMSQHPAVNEAMASLQKEISDRQKKLEGLSSKEKIEKQKEMQKEINNIILGLQMEIFNKVKKDIEEVAKREGYSCVFDKNVIISGGKDITEEVINFKKIKSVMREKKKNSSIDFIPVK